MKKEIEDAFEILQKIALRLCCERATPSDGLDMINAMADIRCELALKIDQVERKST